MAVGPFKGNYTSLNQSLWLALLLLRHHLHLKEKELLLGDHLTYFVRLPFRKRRVTDSVADCSSKILFP